MTSHIFVQCHVATKSFFLRKLESFFSFKRSGHLYRIANKKNSFMLLQVKKMYVVLQ
jgi:hypothetical protein